MDEVRSESFLENVSIFSASNDPRMNACINWMNDASQAYIMSFKDLADVGTKHVTETLNGRDIFIYSIAYLYRHHLELLMKDIIKDGNSLLNVGRGVPRVHNLLRLWSECKEIILKVWPNGPKADIENAERILTELANIDPEGETFRYSTKKDGSNVFEPSIRTLNFAALSNAVGNVSDFLSGVNFALGDYLSNRDLA